MATKFRFAAGLVALMCLGASVSPGMAEEQAPRFSLPLDCVAHKTCFIQNYVDADPTKAVRDYTCRKSSNDGHKGVDFRLRSVAAMEKGVQVRASATGVVKAVRTDMEDHLLKGTMPSSMKGRECGNGVVITHQEGWETQYCHMRKGSLKVKQGDKVERGQMLGLVGLSGQTAFPHLHLTIRHDGKVMDPFSGRAAKEGGCGTTGMPLFETSVIEDFSYRSGRFYLMGFTEQSPTKAHLMAKGEGLPEVTNKSKALFFYGMVLNPEKGDRLWLGLVGPTGLLAQHFTKPMERHKADYYGYIGKKRTADVWPKGSYKGMLRLLRGDKIIWEKQQGFVLR